jgi:hypothetical protein
MSFADIDLDEFDLLIELLIDFVETHGSINIRRSGEAAENQGYRHFSPEISQPERALALNIQEFKIGGNLSRFGSQGIVVILPVGSLLSVFDRTHEA